MSLSSQLAQPEASAAANDEPAYCDPATFRQRELAVTDVDVQRLHAFRLGGVLLVGMAVGYSNAAQVQKLATTYSQAGADTGYCTWYYNVRNPEAARLFNYHPVNPNPNQLDAKTARELFERVVGPNLDQDAVNQVMCAERYGYVASGCDAQKHRGPTAFAMLLAFSGCTPEHAAQIANDLWGLNGVAPEVRLAVAQAGQELGRKHPASRKRLQAKFSEPGAAADTPRAAASPR